MTILSIFLFSIISIISIVLLIKTDEPFEKMLMFFYFINNFITFILSYFLFSNKFGFIINMLFPLIILSSVLVLLFIKEKIKSGEMKWFFTLF